MADENLSKAPTAFLANESTAYILAENRQDAKYIKKNLCIVPACALLAMGNCHKMNIRRKSADIDLDTKRSGKLDEEDIRDNANCSPEILFDNAGSKDFEHHYYLTMDMEEVLGKDDSYVVEKRKLFQQTAEWEQKYCNSDGIKELEDRLKKEEKKYERWKKRNPDLARMGELWYTENLNITLVDIPRRKKIGEEAQAERIKISSSLGLTERHMDLIRWVPVFLDNKRELEPYFNKMDLPYDDRIAGIVINFEYGNYQRAVLDSARDDLAHAKDVIQRNKPHN